jgi:hypothetical protein
MTKIVIPPPQQSAIEDKPFNEPWRRHMDVTNAHVNAASQLISVVNVTAGSSGVTIKMPGGWSSARLVINNLQIQSTLGNIGVRVSTGETIATAGYSGILHTVNAATASDISTSVGAWLLTPGAGAMTTVSTGGFSGEVDFLKLDAVKVRVVYRGAFLDAATTPLQNTCWGGGSISITDGAISAVTVRSSAAAANSFSTGRVSLYGNR